MSTTRSDTRSREIEVIDNVASAVRNYYVETGLLNEDLSDFGVVTIEKMFDNIGGLINKPSIKVKFVEFGDSEYKLEEQSTTCGRFTRGKHFLQKVGEDEFIVSYSKESSKEEICYRAMHELGHFVLHWNKMDMGSMKIGKRFYCNDVSILENDAWDFAHLFVDSLNTKNT